MSQQAFPEQVDVRRFFSQERIYKASIPLQRFSRLTEYLSAESLNRAGRNRAGSSESSESAEDGDAAIDPAIIAELNFSRDQEGRKLISGSISGELQLDCQRCLQSVPYSLDTALSVLVLEGLDESVDSALDKDGLDVVLAQDGQLDLLAMVEDELILSLPIVVYHDSQDCNQALNKLKKAELSRTEDGGPFAKLESLKQQLRQSKGDNNRNKK